MYQTGGTIESILNKIHRHDLVLPAIQREFVWKPEQICRLFDSLMQGYPFGTFLYWRVEPENSGEYQFFDFVRNYHQRDAPHCPPLERILNRPVTAVLDGQQRLTALNIGLKGSMTLKQPGMWWKNPLAFRTRKLYLDLLWQPHSDDDDGSEYRFEFLSHRPSIEQGDGEYWFEVGTVLSLDDAGPAMTELLGEQLSGAQLTRAHRTLFNLYQVIRERSLVSYYEEESQKLERALQIFIRMNDGGTQLSHSDLLLSLAVAQWRHHDARQEIHDLVDELNSSGDEWSFSKDFVLKSGLMLSDLNVRFKVNNFNRENMNTFEGNWNAIRRSLRLTVQLVNSFGFNGRTLTSHSAIIPIAYYLYMTDSDEGLLYRREFQSDREAIRVWLTRSLLKSGVWGSGLDTLLTHLRAVINSNDCDGFPARYLHEEMTRRGRGLIFEDEEIEELADLKYNDRKIQPLLLLIFHHVNPRNYFHIDHIFPKSKFTNQGLREAGIQDDQLLEFHERRDRLANLQLLEGHENILKSDTMPDVWLAQEFLDEEARCVYRDRHMLGQIPDSMTDFVEFYENRRERLKTKIKQLLGTYPSSS